MLSNGVLYVLILNRFTMLPFLHCYYCFSRPSFRAIVSALWCIFHHVRICAIILSWCNCCMESINCSVLNIRVPRNTSLHVFQWRPFTLVRVLYEYALPVSYFFSQSIHLIRFHRRLSVDSVELCLVQVTANAPLLRMKLVRVTDNP